MIVELNRYQPLMAVTQDRLECECGALAIYVLFIQDKDSEKNDLCFYCQACFSEAQVE
jgi:hypothetical protein